MPVSLVWELVYFKKGKPVAFASRSLLPVEANYAQIEKVLLAVVYLQ